MIGKPSVSDEEPMEKLQEKEGHGEPEEGMENEAGSAKNILSEHKGKLAIGVAATLGLMVFYNWRQKRLSKEDPEAYARIQKITSKVKSDTVGAKPKSKDARHGETGSSTDIPANPGNETVGSGKGAGER